MATIRIKQFDGLVPKLDPEELPPNAAQVAQNCRLYRRKLQPIRTPKQIQAISIGGTCKSIFLLNGNWLEWNTDVDVALSPLLDDNVGRYYFTGTDKPRLSDLGGSLIGVTPVNTALQDDVAHAIASGNYTYFNNTIASVGINVGDTLNAVVNLFDVSGTLTNGYLYIQYINGSNGVIRTDTGSAVAGASYYTPSILQNSVVPAGTVKIAVGVNVSGYSQPYCRNLRVTDGVVGSYPAGSYVLGLPVPLGALTATPQGVSGTVTAVTNNAVAGGGLASANCTINGNPGDVFINGTARVTANWEGSGSGQIVVTVTDQTSRVVGKVTQEINVTGSTAEPNWQAFPATYSVKDTVTAGQLPITYTATITITWDGGASPPLSGAILYQSTINARDQSSVTVTLNNASQIVANNSITFTGVLGMTDLNNTFLVQSVNGNNIVVLLDTNQAYTSGGTWTQTYPASATEDRTYTYTYVASINGVAMEGAPAPASAQISCGTTQLVDLTGILAAPAGYGITAINLYRTVTASNGSTSYQFLAAIAPTATTYNDSILDAALGLGLPTPPNLPPPGTMVGLVSLPSGVLCGFTGNQIIMSAAYLPHSYPIEYQQTTEKNIVGLSINGASVFVLTQGKPYILTGPDPADMSLERIEEVQSCVSKRSIVNYGFTTVYAGPDGLVMVGPGVCKVITAGIMDRDDWQAFVPSTITAARYRDWYVGFYDATSIGGVQGGFIYNPSDPESSFVLLSTYATAAFNDLQTGNLYLVVNGNIQQFDAGLTYMNYTWQSKNFVFDRDINLGRCILRAASTAYPVTMTLTIDDVAQTPINVANAASFSLPSGIKGRKWSVSLQASDVIKEVLMAETAAELRQIE